DIRQQHRRAALLRQHDVLDVVDRAHHAEATYIDGLLAHRNVPPTDIGVAGGDGLQDLRQSEAIGHHAVEIDLGLELLGLAAHHRYAGNAGNDAQLALHHPDLQRLELHEVHSGRALELVAHDFTDAA